ncbi:hypothetical protein FSP39_021205 [Pinctada imbricata]|uniref:Uncharacterized protein n=1 Tax=Pinctada imbricata TaxID=66713 RepID=A0AA88YL27_PINIB|nr:hypothetical protein FSP39_001196 [Pinctada imbricata]KAK3107738.1 hypothetical protein FSP39_021205 [Pinctada imbricata]
MEGYKNRKTRLEREKAIEGARNPGVSKFGISLADINCKRDKLLFHEMRKIENEVKCMQLKMNQQKKSFVKSCHVLNYDPIILVERPPSPEVIKKATAMSYGIDENEYREEFENAAEIPGYMRQLRSRQRTPSTLTTIDAFTVKSKKKKNVWEDTRDQKEPPVFTSTVRPFMKLTKREQSDLQLGWSFHKPRLTPAEDAVEREGLEEYRKSKTPPRSAKRKHRTAATQMALPAAESVTAKKPEVDTTSGSDSEDEFTPFITQMAKIRTQSSKVKPEKDGDKEKERKVIRKEKTSSEIPIKSVRFSSGVPGSPIKRRANLAATKVTFK